MKKLRWLVLWLICTCVYLLSAQRLAFSQQAVSSKVARHSPLSAPWQPKEIYLGLGSGLSYGWNGLNIEMPLYQKLYLMAGAGVIYMRMGNFNQHLTQPAYNGGLALNFSAPHKRRQHKIMALWGVNEFSWQANYGGMRKKSYQGISLGLSNTYMFGRQQTHGFSIEGYWLVSSTYYREYSHAKEPFRFGFGYRRKLR